LEYFLSNVLFEDTVMKTKTKGYKAFIVLIAKDYFCPPTSSSELKAY